MPLPPAPPPIVYVMAQAQTMVVVQVTVEDGLRLGELIHPAGKPLTIFVLSPSELVPNGELTEAQQEQLLRRLYGDTWREGNSDGSAYVVLSYSSSRLPEDQVRAGGWRATPGAWLYRIRADGVLEKLGEGYVPR